MSAAERLSEPNAATDHLSQVFQHMNIGGHARVHMGNVIHNAPSALPPSPRAVIPFSRDPNFVGREDLLTRIFEILKPGEHAHQRMVLRGLGGIGKSQIAIEFAYRYREQHPDHWVFWIYAASQERFIDAFEDIAACAGLPTEDFSKNDMLKAVRRWLSSNEVGTWLLIVDNADDKNVLGSSELATELLSHYLPQAHNGNILVTTRNDVGASLCDIHAHIETINPFSMNSGWNLWKKLDPSTESRKQVEPLLRKIDCIPLAIRQAAAYVRQTHVALAQYMTLLDGIDNEAELWSREWQNFRRQSEQNAVFLTWNVSFNQMRDHHPEALDFLTTVAVLEQLAVPEVLLRNSTSNRTQHEAVGQLFAFSLVRRDETDKSLRMHRLVRECIQAWIKKENIWQECFNRGFDLATSYSIRELDERPLRECEDLVSHALPLTWSFLAYHMLGSNEHLRKHVSDMLGVLLLHYDDLLPTRRLQQVLTLCTDLLGVSHERTLQLRVLLCRRNSEANELDLAEQRAQRLLQDLTQETSKFSVLALLQVYMVLGRVQLRRGRADDAREFHLHARGLWESEAIEGLELSAEVIKSVRELAYVLHHTYHDKHCENVLEVLLRRLRDSELSDILDEAECCWMLGLLYRQTKGNLTALKWLQHGRELYKPCDTARRRGSYLLMSSEIVALMAMEGLYESAATIIAEAEALLLEIPQEEDQAHIKEVRRELRMFKRTAANQGWDVVKARLLMEKSGDQGSRRSSPTD